LVCRLPTAAFVWWETLQDLSLFFGMPEVGVEVGPGQFLETAQVDPDIRVMNDPESTAEGRDPQLERAVAALLKGN
jgi:tricorn protease